jgi:hypothetical protein
VRTCDSAVAFESCRTITATTLDRLAAGIAVRALAWPQSKYGPRYTSTTLGGEPATSILTIAGTPTVVVQYIVAIHDGRPFIVRAEGKNGALSDLDEILHVLERFSFRSPTTFEPTDPDLALEPYANTDLGFKLLVPSIWADAAHVGRSYVLEGSAVSFPGERPEGPPAVRIHVGEPGPSTLADMEELLESACPVYREVHSYRFLDGEIAGIETTEGGNNCIGYPGSRYHVYAIHDGRPIVLEFDYWLYEFGRLAPRDESWRLVESIVDSFEFTDSHEATPVPGAADLQTFRAPGDSFEIRLPAGWGMRDGPDPTALYVAKDRIRMSIRVGDKDNRIQTCDATSSAPFESCSSITATTLEDLADGIAVSGGQHPHLGPNSAASALGGEAATSITVVSGVSPPVGVLYVVAVHDGRPFIVRARQDRPPDPLLEVLRVLKGFSFR